MTVPMTEQIQSVICAVQAYKKWLHYHSVVCGVERENAEHRFEMVRNYYSNQLPLPEGMDASDACFDAVLSYPIEKTLNTQMSDLPKLFRFGY